MFSRSTETGVGKSRQKDTSTIRTIIREAFIRVVSDGYFEALGIALKSGRAFTEADQASSEPVVMVNETMASGSMPRQRSNSLADQCCALVTAG
jgi:hypothetical protein